MHWGKLCCTLAGLALLQYPLGAFAGLLIGIGLDMWLSRRQQERQLDSLKWQSLSVLATELAAALAKADGIVDQAEIRAFKLNTRVQLSERQLAGQLFNRARKANISVEAVIQRLAILGQANPMRLMQLYQVLQAVCIAGGAQPRQRDILNRAARHWGIADQGTYDQTNSDQYRQQKEEQPRSKASGSVAKAAKQLGVPTDISLAELREVYRDLVRRYHPDKLRAKDASEARIKAAEEKLGEINDAYETLRSYIDKR